MCCSVWRYFFLQVEWMNQIEPLIILPLCFCDKPRVWAPLIIHCMPYFERDFLFCFYRRGQWSGLSRATSTESLAGFPGHFPYTFLYQVFVKPICSICDLLWVSTCVELDCWTWFRVAFQTWMDFVPYHFIFDKIDSLPNDGSAYCPHISLLLPVLIR